MRKRISGIAVGLIGLGMVPFLAVSCGEDGAGGSRIAEVSVRFQPAQFDAILGEVSEIVWEYIDGRNTYPSLITEMVVEVRYSEEGTTTVLTKEISGDGISGSQTVRFEVPSGDNRTFRVEAINRAGEIMFSGQRTMTVDPSSAPIEVTLPLSFHCSGTAYDPEGDSFKELYEKLTDFADVLGDVLGIDLGNINVNSLVDFDVLSLRVAGGPTEVVVTAEFLENISQANFFAAILLDTDMDPDTPAGSVLHEIAHLIDDLGGDYILFILEERAVLVDLGLYSGDISGVTQSGVEVPLTFDRDTAEVRIPASAIAGYAGESVGFFGYFGDDGVPTDVVSNWGVCPTP